MPLTGALNFDGTGRGTDEIIRRVSALLYSFLEEVMLLGKRVRRQIGTGPVRVVGVHTEKLKG